MADRVPRLVANIDVRKFKLDPVDGFVLSRIDGRLGPKALAHETGLPESVVEGSLEKLTRLGILEGAASQAGPTASMPPRAPGSGAPTMQPPKGQTTDERRGLPAFVSIGGPKYDPRELEESADLTLEQKTRILDLYYRLDDLDHFTLLGLTREADKKAVKRAYFDLASLLHPDRYFKKNLGAFKAKMEVVFDKITEAHDTLVDREKRAEYELRIARAPSTLGMEALLERALEETRRRASSTPPAHAVTPPAPSFPARAATTESVRAPGHVGHVGHAGHASMMPTMPPGPAREPTPDELRARKEALARKLLGTRTSSSSSLPAAPRSAPPTPHPRYDDPAEAVEALKRRYVERVEGVAAAQAKAHMERAERALAEGDVATASASFKAAAKYVPQDADVTARVAEARRQAQEVVLANALRRAEEAERSGRGAEAARAWETVAKHRVGDAYAHHKVARLHLSIDEGDLHEAAEHAKKAVLLDPQKVDFHMTLAEVYLRAGLVTSARKAAETGLQLAPDHQGLRGLLKKAEKSKS